MLAWECAHVFVGLGVCVHVRVHVEAGGKIWSSLYF